MSRWLAGLLLYVALAAVAVILTTTETGLRWAWVAATPFIPAEIKVSSLQGQLLGPLRLQGLEYRDEERLVQAQAIEWDWRSWRLLSGVLDITRLQVQGLRYTALTPSTGIPRLPASLQPRLELQLRNTQLQDFHYIAAPGDAPVVVEQLGFTATTGLMGLQLDDIQLHAGDIRATGAGRIRLRGDYPIKAELQGQGSATPDTRWQGAVVLQGSLRALELELALLSPQPAQATGQFRWVDDRLELDAELGTQAWGDWAHWLKLPATGVTGINGSVRARYQGTRVQLQQAEIHLQDQPLQITLQGEVDLATEIPQSELQLQWQALRWPLDGEPLVDSPAGQLKLSGSPQQYQIQGEATMRITQTASADLKLQGMGGREQLKIDVIQGQVANGSFTGQGQLNWSDVMTLALLLKGSDINPAVLYPQWPGKLAIESKAQASWPEAGLQLQIEQFTARGQLRDRSLSLNSQLRLLGDNWQIEQAELRAGKTRLSLQGRYGDQSDLHATLDSPDLADLLPGTGGSLQGSGQWRGTTASPRISAKLHGRDLRYQAHHLARLELDAELDGRDTKNSQLNLKASEGQLAGIALQALSLSAQGAHTSHDARLQLQSELGDLEVQATGRWTGGFAWQATIHHSELRPTDAGKWLLSAPAELQLSRESVALSTACWADKSARACLQGEWLPGVVKAAADLRQLPLTLLQPFLPAGIYAAGLLDANGTWQQHAGAAMSGQAALALVEGKISRLQPSGKRAQLQLRPSRADVRLEAGALDIKTDLNLAPSGQVALALQLPWPSPGDKQSQPLRGQVRADLPNLDFVSTVLPELDEVRGRVIGELRIAGTVAEPRGEGGLQLSDGALRIDRLGLRVEALTAQLRTDGRDGLRLDASARSGDGDLKLQAKTSGGLKLSTVDATLRGTNVLVYNDPDARVHLSPDLTIKVRTRDVNITGEVRVPRAEITPRQYAQTGAVTTSSDEVLVSQDESVETVLAGWSVSSRVRLIMGDAVHFDGLGLKAKLAGELQLKDEPGELTTASGELRVKEGKYTAYGQELDVTTGRLLFNGGPLIEPAMDARAERKPVDKVVVGVQLRGPLKSPRVTLFSDPAMPDAERLSYLMFGTPLDNNAGARNLVISQAAHALGLTGGEAMAKSIGMHLGADEVQFQSGSGEGLDSTRLVIGKYLSARLYVSYGIGLFDAVRTLRLRYRLSPRWTLETESGTHSGGDLLYSIER